MRGSQGWFETDDELYYVASDGTVYLHTTPDVGHSQTLPKLPAGAWQCNPRHIDPDWHDWAGEIERKATCTAQEATIRELADALEAVLDNVPACVFVDTYPWEGRCGIHDFTVQEPGKCAIQRAVDVLARTRGES
mgnify:CR=1 FL=1